MAAMASSQDPTPSAGVAPAGQRRLAVPSPNPLPLSSSQEAQVREIYYQRVRNHCSAELKAFADCAMGRTFTVAFACRDQHRLMNSCMKRHATQDEQDAAREEWFAERRQRQRDAERKARKKSEQEDFIREWWRLPDKDPEVRRKEVEKLALPERVGGFGSKERRSDGER